MTPPATITVGPSLSKILGGVTIATIAVGAGAALLVLLFERLAAAGWLAPPVPPWLWSYRWTVVAGLATLLTCYRGVAVLGAIFWARPRIEIGLDGFTDYGAMGKRSRRWSEIEGSFAIVRVGWPFALTTQPVVAYRLTEAFKAAARIKPQTDLFAGNDEAILIGVELAIDAEELANMLNQCKQAATPAE